MRIGRTLSFIMFPVPVKTVSSAIRDLLLISPEENFGSVRIFGK